MSNVHRFLVGQQIKSNIFSANTLKKERNKVAPLKLILYPEQDYFLVQDLQIVKFTYTNGQTRINYFQV